MKETKTVQTDYMVYRDPNAACQEQPKSECSNAEGKLMPCAPLANPYVPFQQADPETYEARQGLVRGTLFPGLDLPFMGMVNKEEKSDTVRHQMQALHFAVNELALYLDTHPDDKEALDLFRKYQQMYCKGEADLIEKYGAQTMMQAGKDGNYDWVQNPWPWELAANEED